MCGFKSCWSFSREWIEVSVILLTQVLNIANNFSFICLSDITLWQLPHLTFSSYILLQYLIPHDLVLIRALYLFFQDEGKLNWRRFWLCRRGLAFLLLWSWLSAIYYSENHSLSDNLDLFSFLFSVSPHRIVQCFGKSEWIDDALSEQTKAGLLLSSRFHVFMIICGTSNWLSVFLFFILLSWIKLSSKPLCCLICLHNLISIDRWTNTHTLSLSDSWNLQGIS